MVDSSDPDDVDEKAESAGEARIGERSKRASDGGLLDALGPWRPFLGRYGITLDASETSDLLANPVGGFRQGGSYEGLFSAAIGIDLGKAVGLTGASVNVSFDQQHSGPGLSASNIGNFNVVSDIEDKPSGGLNELWLEQAFGGNLDVRAGRMSVDEEFMTADSADIFMNGSFGWAALPFKDLPNGGPIPAEAAVRAHVKIGTAWDALAGVYKGSEREDPDPSALEGSDRGVLAIAELQYATGSDKETSSLPATFKVGGWYRDGTVTPAFTPDSAPVGDLPDMLRHNGSLYAVVDQRLTRSPDDESAGFSVFARVMATPSDRNRVTAYADGGLVYANPFGRKDDAVGLGIVVAQTSATAPALDEQAGIRLGRAEIVFESSYQAQLAKGVMLQPDVQVILNPAGGHVLPSGRLIGDALVFGLRTTLTF